jgi:hypothetical protein
MAGYIYLPVPTHEFIDYTDRWGLQRAWRLGKPHHEVLQNKYTGWRKGFWRRLGYGVLKLVQPDDKLYVMAHGIRRIHDGIDIGVQTIGAFRGGTLRVVNDERTWEGGIKKAYSPEELAELLEKEGLTKHFQDLRIFACNSARSLDPHRQDLRVVPCNSALTIDPLHNFDGSSFAQRLGLAMKQRGYFSIKVTGYLGNVKSSHAQRHVWGAPGKLTPRRHKGTEIDGVLYRASAHKVVY